MDVGASHQAGVSQLPASEQSAMAYLQALIQQGYRRITFIQLNLKVPRTVAADELHRMVTELRSAVRRQRGAFAHCLGMFWTVSYGTNSKVLHCLLMFDGVLVQQDIAHGDDIGRYWVNIITDGQGSYRNLNQYRQLVLQSGLGVICTCSVEEVGWVYYRLRYGLGPVGRALIVVGVPTAHPKHSL